MKETVFVPLYKTDVIEKQYYDIPQDESLKTRLLYFDLKKADIIIYQ